MGSASTILFCSAGICCWPRLPAIPSRRTAATISSSVKSGCLATSSRSQAACASNGDVLPPLGLAATCSHRSVWRRRAPTARFGGGVPEPHKPLHPPLRRTHAYLEPFRRFVPRRTRPPASTGPTNTPSTSIASKKPNQCQKIRASKNLGESPCDSLTPEHALASTTLRYPYEIRNASDYFRDIVTPRVTRGMIKLAEYILAT